MIFISFIPWLLYSLVNIKYSKKENKLVNYYIIMCLLIYLYFTKFDNLSILLPVFFVLGIFLLVDTYYNIPESKERVKNAYSKFLYAVPFIPVVAYVIFKKEQIIFLSMFIISFLIDGFIYLYTSKKR